MRTRRRSLADWQDQVGGFSFKYYYDYLTGNGKNPVLIQDITRQYPDWDSTGTSFKGLEITQDENHGVRNSRDLRDRGGTDVGGPFFNQKKRAFIKGDAGDTTIDQKGFNTDNGAWSRMIYTGPVLAVNPQDSMFPSYSATYLTAKGTTAIARCKPTNSIVELSTTLGETIHDGLPKLLGHAEWKPKTKAARKAAGDEYLNVQFGWLPLVSDVQGAAYALANARRLIDSYERNSGKIVRRRYEFPVEKTESTVDLGVSYGHLFSGQNAPGILYDASKPRPHLIKHTKSETRTWFSGAFTYHLPVGYSSREWLESYYAQAQYLLGIKLDPSTVWNLAPWSWAVDWVSNMGDLISNITDWSSDGLVLRYGYIMEHSLQEITYSLDGPTRFNPYGSIFASPVTFQLETKRREKATPFGFDVNFDSFTSRQKAIVVALGLSRS
jgi:hypothetical protein